MSSYIRQVKVLCCVESFSGKNLPNTPCFEVNKALTGKREKIQVPGLGAVEAFIVYVVEQQREDENLNFDQLKTKWNQGDWERLYEVVKSEHPTTKLSNWKEVRSCYNKTNVKVFNFYYGKLTDKDLNQLRHELSVEEVATLAENKVLGQKLHEIPVDSLRYLTAGAISAQKLHTNGGFDKRYGISEEEYVDLSDSNRRIFDQIRDLVWNFVVKIKAEFPQGSRIRNFWTVSKVRKAVVLELMLKKYRKENEDIPKPVEKLLRKMRSI